MVQAIVRTHVALNVIAGKRVVERHVQVVVVRGHVAMIFQRWQATSQCCLIHAAARHARGAFLGDSGEVVAGRQTDASGGVGIARWCQHMILILAGITAVMGRYHVVLTSASRVCISQDIVLNGACVSPVRRAKHVVVACRSMMML